MLRGERLNCGKATAPELPSAYRRLPRSALGKQRIIRRVVVSYLRSTALYIEFRIW